MVGQFKVSISSHNDLYEQNYLLEHGIKLKAIKYANMV